MNNAGDLEAHLGLDRDDVPALSLGKVLFLEHLGIATGGQNHLQVVAHPVLQILSLLRQPPEVGCRRFPDIALWVHAPVERRLDGLQRLAGFQRRGLRPESGRLLALPLEKPADLRRQPQHDGKVPQLMRLERRALHDTAECLPDIRERQRRKRFTALRHRDHFGGLLQPGSGRTKLGLEGKGAAPFSSHR